MSIEALTWVLKNSEATLGDRLVLISLADHAHADGTKAFPALSTIARQARMSERNARRCLRNLEEGGHIKRSGQTKAGVSIYVLQGVNLSSDFLNDGSMTDRGTNQVESEHDMSAPPDNLSSPSKVCPQCGLTIKGKTVTEHLADTHGIGILEAAEEYAEATKDVA